MWSYGGWLDQHARCTGRHSWSARPGSLGTALTRKVLGREASICPLEGWHLAGPGSEGWRSSAPSAGFIGMCPIGSWADTILSRAR